MLTLTDHNGNGSSGSCILVIPLDHAQMKLMITKKLELEPGCVRLLARHQGESQMYKIEYSKSILNTQLIFGMKGDT